MENLGHTKAEQLEKIACGGNVAESPNCRTRKRNNADNNRSTPDKTTEAC